MMIIDEPHSVFGVVSEIHLFPRTLVATVYLLKQHSSAPMPVQFCVIVTKLHFRKTQMV